ncbi:hypothetical protein ABZ897_09480 [Nonomuraea sp. NPDC046802]|uniref:hypothetical protein n=1 Tax=Nonomuraea sp. NPDC046802 TaxID=3154919 RepID=UPI0033EBFE18
MYLTCEGVLLVVAVARIVAVGLASAPPKALSGIFDHAGVSGLPATAVAFSLRTGTPNVAVGAIATLA